jgi:hydroxypyruvate isomerase
MNRAAVNRRHFLHSTIGAVAAWRTLGPAAQPLVAGEPPAGRTFAMNFAPHFGMFRHLGGRDLISQLEFAADQGFDAWEDNEMKMRPVETQKRIAETMTRLNMKMGVISALRGVWNDINFAAGTDAARKAVLTAMTETVDVAKRVNGKFLTVVLGLENPKVPFGYQTASCIELLKQCCDLVEPHGLVMVLEPLNRKKNHPGIFLSGSPQAYMICSAINRPSCKILFDIYHQQITEGNLIANIGHCWEEIAYFQSGDNPGRKEPGTGEINYQNIFRHLRDKGYRGIVGMEHGISRRGAEGERALIDAYHQVDPA